MHDLIAAAVIQAHGEDQSVIVLGLLNRFVDLIQQVLRNAFALAEVDDADAFLAQFEKLVREGLVEELLKAIYEYSKRDRRFGKVK